VAIHEEMGTVHDLEALWGPCVPTPQGQDLESILSIHAQLGFPGCVGMADGVEFPVQNVPDSELNTHRGGKSSVRVRSYNFIGDATKRIHAVRGSWDGIGKHATGFNASCHRAALDEERVVGLCRAYDGHATA